MYEGRPDRYFDDLNDNRKPRSATDHQFTREVIYHIYINIFTNYLIFLNIFKLGYESK